MDRHSGSERTRSQHSTASETDAWSREVQWVPEEARRLGLVLDEEELILQDVRDLPALRAALSGLRTRQTGTRWAGLDGLWTRAAAAASPHRA